MTVGFSGTYKGMNDGQKAQLRAVLKWLNPTEVHVVRTEDRKSSIAEASRLAQQAGIDVIQHALLPPSDIADLNTRHNRRDRYIVKNIDLLIVALQHDQELVVTAGGSDNREDRAWNIVRYTRQAGKPVLFLTRGIV